MNRIYIILIFLATFVTNTVAQTDEYLKLYNKANDLYSKADYEGAIKLYNQVIVAGYEAPELYFNLANAYYKTDNIPKAILYYEKAKLLAPSDEKINANLDFVSNKIIDKIDEIPQGAFNDFFRSFVTSVSTDVWAISSVIAFIAALALLLFYLFSRQLRIRKTSFFVAVILFVFSMLTFFFAAKEHSYIRKHDGAIIMNEVVAAKSSPDEYSTVLFKIHEGLKVKIVDESGEWVEIKLADGRTGWIKKSEFERI